MRHLAGFFIGILGAPALALGIGWGANIADAMLADRTAQLATNGPAVVAVSIVMVAGVLLGLLSSTRWLSPLASLLIGMQYVALTVWYLIVPAAVTELLPSSAAVRGLLPGFVPAGDLMLTTQQLLQQGVFGMLGAALLVSSLVPRRWSAGPAADEELSPLSDMTWGGDDMPWDGGYGAPGAVSRPPSYQGAQIAQPAAPLTERSLGERSAMPVAATPLYDGLRAGQGFSDVSPGVSQQQQRFSEAGGVDAAGSASGPPTAASSYARPGHYPDAGNYGAAPPPQQ